MKRSIASAFGVAVGLGLAACGQDGSLPAWDADLRAPSPRQARVTVTPALDFSDASSRLGQHFVVDELVVNLADVRILGEDPSIPAGGYPLTTEPTLVYAEGSGEVGVELPFPPAFLDHEGLAIYLRSEPSDELDGASIMVSGRWVEDGATGNALTGVVDPDGEPVSPTERRDGVVDPDGEPVRPEDRDGVVDPDGEPVRPEDRDGVVDPDGEPVRPEDRDGVVDPDGEPVRPEDRDGVVDPDGEPVRPGERSGVVDPDGEPVDCLEVDCARSQQALLQGTPVVLREVGVVELVVSLDQRSRFNLVFGIPATRWIDEETSDRIVDEVEMPSSSDGDVGPAQPIIITTSTGDLGLQGATATPGSIEDQPAGGYYLADGLPIEDAITRGGM